ncbi:DUF2274 domain-containing protein [Sphingopyxis sp. KK2]|uniref:DUF2274 domain-containing protein n=1 Tax=Sphingopyxis sp. KK2 TaxID=1855727 RepID=UPI00097E670E|nr:DUF2274 domain-containing protein [Sphingopyxis sp. KK2]
MPDLKLAKIPDRKPVKLQIEILPDLEAALADYAAAYAKAYNVHEKPAALIPYMLSSFIDGDREFAKLRKQEKPGS